MDSVLTHRRLFRVSFTSTRLTGVSNPPLHPSSEKGLACQDIAYEVKKILCLHTTVS